MIGNRAEAGLNRRWRRRVRHRALFTPVNDEQGSLAEIHAPPVNNYRREWRGRVPIAGRAERSHAGTARRARAGGAREPSGPTAYGCSGSIKNPKYSPGVLTRGLPSEPQIG